MQSEEECFSAGYHQNVEKEWQKVWHDRHLKNKKFKVEGLVLLYESKFLKNPDKIKTHWLGPYVVIQITKGGTLQLDKLDGTPFKGMVNGIRLNPYQDIHDLVDWKKKMWIYECLCFVSQTMRLLRKKKSVHRISVYCIIKMVVHTLCLSQGKKGVKD